MQAYLSATDEHNILLASADQQQAWEAATKRIKDEMQRLKAQAKQLSGKERDDLDARIEALDDQLPPPLATIPSTWNDFQKQTAIHVLKRGAWENKGELVGARPLSVLVSDDVPELSPGTSDPRTRLARWLTSPDQPLASRVIVNRLWQYHFGRGLVGTANDFGLKGERPSHPELLDWLSTRFIDHGWQWKAMHRTIVQSSIYRQSSHPANRELSDRLDPDNRLLSHFTRRRLSAEELRDAMLDVSGRLNFKSGGPSVIVPVDNELVQLLYKPAQWAVNPDSAEHDRRSVYLFAKRNLRLPFMENLDAPGVANQLCSPSRSSTHATPRPWNCSTANCPTNWLERSRNDCNANAPGTSAAWSTAFSFVWH